MKVFAELDQNNSGSVDVAELLDAFEAVGMPESKAFDTFKQMDKSADGSIDLLDWLHIVDKVSKGSEDDVGEVLLFLQRVEDRQRTHGQVLQHVPTPKHRLILRHDSPARMCWDLLMMLLLVY